MLRRPPSLLRPTTTLSSLYRRQRIQPFHASHSRKIDLQLPHLLLTSLHSAGLLWADVIPLTAITIRCLVVQCLTLPALVAKRKEVELAPLISAHAPQLREATEQVLRANRDQLKLLKKKGTPISPESLYKKSMKELHARSRKSLSINRLAGPTLLLQIPIFLWVFQTIRSMLGMPQGLVGTLFSGTIFSKTAVPDTIEPSSLSLDVSDAAVASQMEPSVPNAWFEPTMAEEGPLWIVDLTAPDPTLCLPFIVSGLMYASLRFGSKKDAIGVRKSSFQRRLNNAALFFALMIGPLTLHLPAGFLYYWACSSASALAANVILERMYPARAPVLPCRRPIRRTKGTSNKDEDREWLAGQNKFFNIKP
jgi:mitochondrial inner membrane protein COX18